jgi:hypothetical protein
MAVMSSKIVKMELSQTLIDSIYRERVLAARDMRPEERILAGLRLFDLSCRIMVDGIRNENPEADEAAVQKILRERLALIRRLEQTQ